MNPAGVPSVHGRLCLPRFRLVLQMFANRSIGSSHLLWLPSKLQRQGAEQGYFELELNLPLPPPSSRSPMADRVRMAIVLGVGGAAAGGPEALRLLLAVAGRSAAADVATSAFLICAFTALVLGNLLLARFLRDARRNAEAHAPAPGTERFAKMTAAAALAAMFVVTACLLALPSIPAPGGAARSCLA
ncbi:hypothetical protein GQ55_4G305300 [Panicum hallii var. hallii]|uniref:Uncharacterized protein n=1 Tax=Panicum hallii var. hallii TaxID=1504633 RepID=A0A2T7E1Q4_9POAL|nr:hypothetical protein GQ55_4G305300 [Panicum hallii var. hallii]